MDRYCANKFLWSGKRTFTSDGTKTKLLDANTECSCYFIHSVSLFWCFEIQCLILSPPPLYFPLVQNWSKQMCAQMKTRCPKYKMTSHQENGAKLKKETQCPWTYKNKLILCVSSHCQPFRLVLKIHTHKLRLHWLSFTPARPITITYVHQRPMRKVYVHLTR